MEETTLEAFHQEIIAEESLVVWRISGHLNSSRYKEVRTELARLTGEGLRFIVLDLQGLESLDSRGLGFLVTVQKEVREREGRVVIAHLAARFAILFETTRINRIFEIFLDLESAKRSFGGLIEERE